MITAVFDVETNGLKGSSVLSASSLVFDDKGVVTGLFNRFYMAEETPDFFAARVHGLTPQRIAALRSETGGFSCFFLEEWQDLYKFWESRNVAGIVVHNLNYDASFLPGPAKRNFRWWCSMKGLTACCGIPGRKGRSGIGAPKRVDAQKYKWPRLGEAVEILCNGPDALEPPPETARLENAMTGKHAHVSLFDCFELYRVVARIMRHRSDLPEFAPCDVPFSPPRGKGEFEVSAARGDRFTADILAYEKKLRAAIASQQGPERIFAAKSK